MAQNVVTLKPAKRRLDLRGNNRLKDLIETHMQQAAIIAEATQLKKEADAEIKEILGDAEAARADGYWVSVSTVVKPEHTVRAMTYKLMRIKRFGRM